MNFLRILLIAIILLKGFIIGLCQPIEIAEVKLPETGWINWKIVPVIDYGDSISVFAQEQPAFPPSYYTYNRYTYNSFLPNDWWLSFFLGHSLYHMEYYETGSGFEYVYHFLENWIAYDLESLDYPYPNFAMTPNRPIFDNYGNAHVIWQDSNNAYYGFSIDTLSSFEFVDTLENEPEFIRFVSSPDNEIIAALFFVDRLVFKYSTSSGNPFDFQLSPFVLNHSYNPHYAFDMALIFQGELYSVYHSVVGDPQNEEVAVSFWSESCGQRQYGRFNSDLLPCSPYQLSFRLNDNEIIMISSYVGTFWITFDAGNNWYVSDYDIYCSNVGAPRYYEDTIFVAFDNNSYNLYYQPVARDSIIENLTVIDEHTNTALPSSTNLTSYPNPLNAQTTISFSLERQSPVNISIYDISGRLVDVLISNIYEAGHHSLIWDATGQPSGIYFARLTAGDAVNTSRMVLLK